MLIQENFAEVGSYRLFYRHCGNEPAVVLMHGIPTNSYLWLPVIPALAKHYRVIAPDLLGFGQSDRGPVEDLTLPRQAEHILALLDTLNISKAHFVGHDLGGGIAQILAVHHPQRVLSITVVDGVCFSNWPLREVVSMRWPIAQEFQPSPELVQRMIRLGVFNQELLMPEVLEAFIKPFTGLLGGPEALQLASNALDYHQTEELVPQLSNLQMPVNILWGEHDRFIPPYWGLKLQETIPNSTLKILPGCGHYCMLDNPAMVAQELLTHLQQLTVSHSASY